MLCYILFFATVFVFNVHGQCPSKKQEIVFDRTAGAYSVVVKLADDVPEDSSLLASIRSHFLAASKALYRATWSADLQAPVYFKEVNIVVPKTWQRRAHYDSWSDSSFDFLVLNQDSTSAVANSPSGCGQPGCFVYLPKHVITDDQDSLEHRARQLVQAFSQYRWGLYSEKSLSEDSLSGASQTCPAMFVNAFVNTNKSYASLLYATQPENIQLFCDDSQLSETAHNKRANNAQNRKCSEESAWTVMKRSSDFQHRVPIKRNQTSDNQTSPQLNDDHVKFRTLYPVADLKIALVLDNSTSMGASFTPDDSKRRIDILRQTAKEILNKWKNDTEVATVLFSNESEVLTPLQRLGQVRQQILDSIPENPLGETSIGGAIRAGIDVLPVNCTNCIIILITDGVENTPPMVPEVVEELQESGVRLYAVGIDVQAQDLSEVASSSGGAYFPSGDVNSLLNSLSQLSQEVDAFAIEEVFLDRFVRTGETISGSFIVDPPFRDNVELIMTTNGKSFYTVDVLSPKSESKRHQIQIAPSLLNRATAQLGPKITPGTWKFSATIQLGDNQNKSEIETDVSIKGVLPSASHLRDPVVVMDASFRSAESQIYVSPGYSHGVLPRILYATLRYDGFHPVLDADVQATIAVDLGLVGKKTLSPVILRDNGFGADAQLNDGVYSAYFVEFQLNNGLYSVEFKATSTNRTHSRLDWFVGAVPDDNNEKKQSSCTNRGDKRCRPTTVQEENIVWLKPFSRYYSAGSFSESVPPNAVPGDLFAPSRIDDLSTSLYNGGLDSVVIRWTSPGDELDQGPEPTHYTVWVSTDFNKLVERLDRAGNDDVNDDNFTMGVVRDKLSSPPGEALTEITNLTETFNITAMPLDTTYYFAVVTTDNEGNRSRRSNVASARLIRPKVPNPQVLDSSLDLWIWIVIAACCFLILITVVLIVACVAYRSHSTKQHRRPGKRPTPIGQAAEPGVVEYSNPAANP